MPAWLREPLLHFVVLGAILFGVDHVIASRTEPANLIVVSAAAHDEMRRLFTSARGREPTDEEMAALRRTWLDNEVLYREGLALQLDRGDPTIRDRVIFKALGVVDANVQRPPIDDAGLRAWFDARRARYDEPVRYDFQEAALAGEASEEAVRAFVAALEAGTPPDAQAGLRIFKGRPHANIVQSYGAEFAKALEALPVGRWHAVPAGGGWRAMRLEAIVPGRPASYEALRGVVMQDWTDQAMAEQRSAAVGALARKYVIRVEEGAR